jgi:hypothetical protein
LYAASSSHLLDCGQRRELLPGHNLDSKPLPADFLAQAGDRHPAHRKGDLHGVGKPQGRVAVDFINQVAHQAAPEGSKPAKRRQCRSCKRKIPPSEKLGQELVIVGWRTGERPPPHAIVTTY